MTAMQVPEEIHSLGRLLRSENVGSLLEIGSKFGGSLRILAAYLEPGSRIVSVDLPKGTKLWKETEPALKRTIADLKRDGFDAHLIWGDSKDPSVVSKVRELGPYDAIFLDADHRMPGVTADWEHYASSGRLIAFHDIAWKRAPEWEGVRIDVPEFWNSVKGEYRHREFRFCPTGKNNGIGVLWRS